MSSPSPGPPELRDCLRSRRARITPERALRLERGRGISGPVVDTIARALPLNEAGRSHPFAVSRPGRKQQLSAGWTNDPVVP